MISILKNNIEIISKNFTNSEEINLSFYPLISLGHYIDVLKIHKINKLTSGYQFGNFSDGLQVASDAGWLLFHSSGNTLLINYENFELNPKSSDWIIQDDFVIFKDDFTYFNFCCKGINEESKEYDLLSLEGTVLVLHKKYIDKLNFSQEFDFRVNFYPTK